MCFTAVQDRSRVLGNGLAMLRPYYDCGPHFGDALDDVDAQHDGVLLVEDAGREDLQDAREHGVQARRRLLVLLHLRRSGARDVAVTKAGYICWFKQTASFAPPSRACCS